MEADMQQFVIVECNERREVRIDGAPGGWTNEILLVNEGTHGFSVDGCLPPERVVPVTGTSPDQPMRIVFVCGGNA
jgi:hypothetical protein